MVHVKDAAEAGLPTNNESEHNHSLLHTIIETIEDTVANLDNDFPLSGGVELPVHHNYSESENLPAKEETKEKASLLNFLDTDFPLSGGHV